ncbi:hypothetical protein [Spirillospora albida]|uniref:hypothetical protein n=1 Tax=Spirillospora albida TaxID=58123 RepID=UPI0004C0BF4A|nr:hypothetical protein [Spirillospora albida]
MHHSNLFYGHAHLFARYCGLDDTAPPRIRGTLQHGWNPVHGFGVMHKVPHGYPKFVWSDIVRRRAWSIGWRDCYVIGAPWNYLLAMEPDLGRVPDGERRGTIWYPFHGWEYNKVAGDHDRLIAEIRATEPGPVTVCLYWLEHRDPRVRARYEDAGFRVICHGYRGWRGRGVEPRFLYGQLAELRRHRRVASNRLSSALLYGTLAGCAPALYGDPMTLAGGSPVYGDPGRGNRMRPELRGAEIDPAVARAVAEEELGHRWVAPPEEIRRLFGWPAPSDREEVLT